MVAGKYPAKVLTVWNSIVHRRGNGFLVVLLADRVPDRTEESQIDALRDLAAKMHEALRQLMEPEG